MLEDGTWLRHAAHANAMACRLADAIVPLPGVRLVAPVQANGVFVRLPQPVIDGLRGRGWRFYVFVGETGCRFMCAWDTPAAAVDRLVADIRALIAQHA
jgi:threonine aldolase